MSDRQSGYNEGMTDGLALGRAERRCTISGCPEPGVHLIEGVDITISKDPFTLYVCDLHHDTLFSTLSRFSTDLSTSPQVPADEG